MLFVRRIDAIAPLARLAVEILPAHECSAGEKVVFDKVERSLHTRRAVSVADLVRYEAESHTLCEGRHLRHWLHLLAASTQHHHMRVVNHRALWSAAHVAQRFGEKRLAIEALKLRPDLEVEQARVAQHCRGGLRLAPASSDDDFVRRGVVLHLRAWLKVIAAGGRDGRLSDALSAA